MFRVPQIEIQELSELILKDADAKARFEASLHDKELPHTIYSVGTPKKEGQTPEEHLREKSAWQRVQRLKMQKEMKK